jgi:hypothetical protein
VGSGDGGDGVTAFFVYASSVRRGCKTLFSPIRGAVAGLFVTHRGRGGAGLVHSWQGVENAG